MPSLAVVGAGLALLASARSGLALYGAALVIGAGNGLSSGLVMTLGQDNAPPEARSAFIGAFKVFTDCGVFVGPLLVGTISHAAGLSAAAWLTSFISLAGAACYAACGTETLVRRDGARPAAPSPRAAAVEIEAAESAVASAPREGIP